MPAAPRIFGKNNAISGNNARRITTANSQIKYGTTPLKISDGFTRNAFAVANTFIPIGGVKPAISHMKQSAITSTYGL